MSTQERDRKQIAMLIIVMLILTFMCGCSGMQIQYPDDKALCDNPTLEQRLATLQRNAEMSGYNSGYSMGIIDAEWFGK